MIKKISILSIAAILVSCGGGTTNTTATSEVKKDSVKPAQDAMPENDLADSV